MRGSGAFRTSAVPGGALAGPWVRNPLWRDARAVPSLDLDFANNKSLTDRVTSQNLVTFTRASSGTFVGSDGLLKTAVTNLKTFSDAILTANGFSTPINATLATVTVATPTTSSTATLLTLNVGANTGNSTDGFNYGSLVTLNNLTQHTQSLFVKPAGATVLRLRSNISGLVADFTLTGNGTAPSLSAELQGASIAPFANGWYRVSWIFTSTTSIPGNRSDYWTIKTNVADGTNGLYLVGAQLEQSSTVGDYVPTTSTINSAPRFDHSITASTTNLCLYSQAISTAPWAANGTETCVASTLTDPAGGLNAFKINLEASSFSRWQQPITVVNGTTYTLSAWVRSTSGTTLFRLRFAGGTTSSDLTATATWQRFTYTLTAGTTAGFFAFNSPSTGAATEIHVYGAQLEQSSTVGPYVPTTTAAVTSNSTESLGLLVEEARTNSIRNNTMLGAVAGTPGTLPTNWGIDVPGLTTSVIGTGTSNGISYIDIRLNGTTSAGYGNIFFESSSGIAATNAQTWAHSLWLSTVGGTTTNLSAIRHAFDLYSSTPSYLATVVSNLTGLSASQSRFSAALTTNNALTAFARPSLSLLWSSGAAIDITLRIGLPQLELGAFATSAIPTTSATATRAADVASITGANFSSWYNQTEGTVLYDGRFNTIAGNTAVVSINDGTINNRHSIRVGNTIVTSAGTAVAFFFQTPALQAVAKYGYGYAVDNFCQVLNSTATAVDTSGALPIGVNTMDIGKVEGSQIYSNGTIKRLVYWGQRLPNNVLQVITQP